LPLLTGGFVFWGAYRLFRRVFNHRCAQAATVILVAGGILALWQPVQKNAPPRVSQEDDLRALKNPAEKYWVAHCLGKTGDERGFTCLEQWLDDPLIVVQSAAIRALASGYCRADTLELLKGKMEKASTLYIYTTALEAGKNCRYHLDTGQ